VGSLNFYSVPTMTDLDGDTVALEVTNIDDLPYFISYDSDYTMFTFVPLK
jgi:hypothetical protein